MINLIIMPTRHETTADLLKHFERTKAGYHRIRTQERKPPHMTHEYIVLDCWTVKLEGHHIFIISDYICNVIDLRFEAPVKIESQNEPW